MHCKQEKMGRARDKGVDMRAHDKQVEVVDCYIFYIYIYLALLHQEFEFQYTRLPGVGKDKEKEKSIPNYAS